MSKNLPEDSQPKQRFTGYWIPVELSKMDLSKTEQFLLSMIDSLEEDAPNFCFASNAYLAEKMELSESQVSRYITKFKKMGLVEEAGFNGRRRRLKTCKENWYSKKELCANLRRQTTQTRAPSIRKSAIPHIYIEEDREQQQKKVAKAPVVVPSSKEEKKHKDYSENDKAAKQYMKKLTEKGEQFVEQAIIKAFRNKDHKPNKNQSQEDLVKAFKKGHEYQGKGDMSFECLKNENGIYFLNLKHASHQPQGVEFKSPTFKKDFEKLLEKLGLSWVINNLKDK